MSYRNQNTSERAARLAIAIGSAIFLSSCTGLPVQSHPVRHVVLMWLKHPEQAAGRAKLIRRSHSLRMIPGVLRVEAGGTPPLPPTAVDRSYDLGVVITFRDRAALERYENDPRSQAAVHRYLKPLVRRYEVYDLDSR